MKWQGRFAEMQRTADDNRNRGLCQTVLTSTSSRLFSQQPCLMQGSGVATKLHSMPLPDSMRKDGGSSVSSLLLPAYPY